MNARPELVAVAVAWSCLAGGTVAPAEPAAETVRGAALKLVNGHEEVVRVTAIRVLGTRGTAEDVPVLVGLAATAATDPEKSEALLALGTMRGKEIDATLIKLLGSAGPAERVVVIRSLADRRPREALATVLGQVSNGDAAVRQEALKALQAVADERSIPTLVGLLAKASPGPDRDALELAIAAGCRRNPDPAKQAAPLVALLSGAGVTLRSLLLPILGQLGGKEALEAINAARQDVDDTVREAAIRGLCNWPNGEIATELLAVAKQPAKPEYRVWAVRALARVVPRSAWEKPEPCAAILKETLAIAEQPADKKYVLSRLSVVRAPEALTTALASTADPALRDEAVKTVIELARGMWTTHQPAVHDALEKIKPLTTDPELRARIDRIIENPDAIRKGTGA